MFNSPFGSFQNTVAEAKEEREQLDRLLTVSTPRERMLVAAIALSLCVLAAWLFFGNVPRSLAVEGVLVESGESERTVRALVWVAHDVAPRIEAGMPAALELPTADGDLATLDGEIAAISPVPLPEGLAAFDSATPVSVRRVEIALDESPGQVSLASGKCRIVIELARQSPVALLRARRP